MSSILCGVCEQTSDSFNFGALSLLVLRFFVESSLLTGFQKYNVIENAT
ncbi:Protein CBR-NHR-238 [Caenorhabditis briggsae]|uniref:Protein CBR-NHR-238 n=1 Tax=Caenorhabditis briggsae TaxID=6238 RepID=A8XAY0_CAEBR|nr:Protein CBR-NHR-238 [Caenorhabditis briggsae]CAP29908.2 Protein CBR-NHR-238 [Caenorhabditis briggsae]